MARKSYPRSKGRREGKFIKLPHHIICSPNYLKMSFSARALLLEFMYQFNGHNNGDLDATYSKLSKRGWKSNATITKAVNELSYYGFIVRIQQGGLNVGGKKRPSLYALSWLPIHKLGYSDYYIEKCDWKLEQIPNTWKEQKQKYKPEQKKATPENGAVSHQ